MVSLFSIFLIIIVPLVFSPCLGAQFLHWDDYEHFIFNPCVYTLSWNNICDLFGQTINQTYVPLTTLSFNLEYHSFGTSPFVAHLINVFLHLAVVLVIFDFAQKMGFSTMESFVASLLFAVHPIHVESVAWVTERKDVLGILFYVLCLKQYWLYLQNHARRNYALSVIFGFLSILSKPMAVSIPWILLLLDWYYQRPWNKSWWLDKLPFALLIFPLAAVTFFKLSPHPDLRDNSFLIGLWSFSWYLEKFFFPINLFPVYDPPVPVTLSNFMYMTSFIILLAFCSLLFLWRKNRLFVFACAFWVGTIFFFWRFDFHDSNIVADRFMYLPSLGFCLLVGKYLTKFKVIGLLTVIVLGYLTFNQCSIWHDDLTLWSRTLSYDPKNTIAKEKLDQAMYDFKNKNSDYLLIKKFALTIDKNSLDADSYYERGEVLLDNGNMLAAFSDFNKAIKINPSMFKAYDMRGQLYFIRQEYRNALDDFNKAIVLKPDNVSAYVDKARILEETGDINQALILFDNATKINPRMGGIYYERGLLNFKLGKYQKAVDDFSQSIFLKNNLENSYYQRGKSYESLKQFDRSVDDFKKSLKEDPYDKRILDALGIVYWKQRNNEKAVEVLNENISMHPYNGNAYNNRGIAYLQQKQFDLALKDFTNVIKLELYPYHALVTRGDIYFSMGNNEEALKDYQVAIFFSHGDPTAQMKYDHLESILRQ